MVGNLVFHINSKFVVPNMLTKACDCEDQEHHKHKGHENHRHVGDECIHEDGTRHKIHQKS